MKRLRTRPARLLCLVAAFMGLGLLASTPLRAGPADGRFGNAVNIRTTPLRTAALPDYGELPITVELWVNLTEDKNSRYNVLVSHAPVAQADHWELYTTPLDGHLRARVHGATITTVERITDDRWHYVALVCDGKTATLYVDGRRIESSDIGPRRQSPNKDTRELLVGTVLDPATVGTHPSLVDELRISRTPREVGTMPTAPFQADDATIGLWRFEETEGTTRQDDSRNRNSLAFSPDIAAAWTPRSSTRSDAEDWEIENDSHWTDGRTNDMDKGRFLGASMRVRPIVRGNAPFAAKGLAIRAGEAYDGNVLFDRGRLQISAAWLGPFVNIPDRRFGLIQHPEPVGTTVFAAATAPGWSGRADGALDRWSPLPRPWGQYLGTYVHGRHSIVSYSNHSTRILELPWTESVDGATAISRTIEAEAAEGDLIQHVLNYSGFHFRQLNGHLLAVAPIDDELAAVALVTETADIELLIHNSQLSVRITARPKTTRYKLLHWRGPATELERFARLVDASPVPQPLEPLTRGGPNPWKEPVVTRGSLGDPTADSPLVVDSLTLPLDNPYRSIFFITGVGVLGPNRLAVSTIYGDVWIVDGVDDDLQQLQWRRFAAGMYQPLGLAIQDGQVCVLERGQITRLHDFDGDDHADYYENLYNGWQTTGAGHAYDTALKLAPDGSFFFFKGQVSAAQPSDESGTLVRVLPDASGHEVFSTGFRHPIGLGVSPEGMVTGADQQGNWMPATRIDAYQRGGFYGDMRTHHRDPAPKTYDRPICWLPQDVDSSAGGQLWIPPTAWGPLGGATLHLSWGRCRLYLLLHEQVGDVRQGGVVRLPTRPFRSGPITGAFNSYDQHLYIAGLHGWQTAAVQDGCLERVRYTGGDVRVPIGFHTTPDGVELQFAEPVDARTATNVARYTVEQWNYRYSNAYGSDHWSVADPEQMGHDSVPVTSVTLSDDARRVTLHLEALRPVMQIKIDWRLQSATGEPMRGTLHGTVHQVPAEKKRDGTPRRQGAKGKGL